MVMVVIGVLSFIMLPVGIDYGIVRYLKDQGADQVSLEDVDFNPITGRMTLTNLSLIIGAQTLLKIPQAILNIEWRPFMHKRFVLERFEISNAELTVQTLEDGSWQIGGIKLPGKKRHPNLLPGILAFSKLLLKTALLNLSAPNCRPI